MLCADVLIITQFRFMIFSLKLGLEQDCYTSQATNNFRTSIVRTSALD